MKEKKLIGLTGLMLCGIVSIGCDIFSPDTNDTKPPDELPIPAVADDDPATVPVPQADTQWQERHKQCVSNVANNTDVEMLVIGASNIEVWETRGREAWDKIQNDYNVINLGISADKTEHVMWRLMNGEFPPNISPKFVVLSIGNNNNGREGQQDKPESIAAGIGAIIKIINQKSPQTKILLLSIPPSGVDNNDIYRKNNNAVNDIIALYDGHCNITYLDINSYFLQDDGHLIPGLFEYDNRHFTLEGYLMLTDHVLECIKIMEQCTPLRE
jgi:lysophospholipase L1-like esterase